MASATAQLIVEATADVSDAKQGLQDLRDNISLVATAAGIVAASMIAFGAVLVDFAKQADEQQRQVARMAFAIDAAGLSADRAVPRFEALFTELSRMSGISDEELREATTAFITMTGAIGLSTAEIERGATLVVDIAAQTGKAANEIARQVADAVAGNAAALTSISPGLREAAEQIQGLESPAARGSAAMQVLQEQFGGAALNAGTAGVNLRVLANEFGDLQQAIGDQVLASGEFQNAMRTTLEVVRDITAQINDPRSGLSESLRNAGMIFEATATSMGYLVRVTASFYDGTVGLFEAVGSLIAMPIITFFDALTTPVQAMVTLFTEGLDPAIAVITGGFDRVGQRMHALGSVFADTALATRDFFYHVVGATPPARVEIDQFGASVVVVSGAATDAGNALQFMFDAMETGVSRAMRMAPGVLATVSAQFESLRSFAFDDWQEQAPSRGATAQTGPTAADRAAKVKESETLLQQARDEAARIQLGNEAAKNQALIELQKLYEQDRLREEEQVAAQRIAAAEETARKIKDSEIFAAREAADERRRLLQMQANIASQSAGTIIGAMDLIASGEAKSGRERRKEIGTTLAAQGRGYLLQAIPESFLNPARATALVAGGTGLVAFGAALGGRVFGSGGGGGSAGGAGFGPSASGLVQPTAAPAVVQPTVVNDFNNALVVANDPDAFRGIARRVDSARESGLGGVL